MKRLTVEMALQELNAAKQIIQDQLDSFVETFELARIHEMDQLINDKGEIVIDAKLLKDAIKNVEFWYNKL